jgi:hypothetical protein
MSVRLMTAVFDRYPNGGGEFTLALALADNAHDDGSHIYPTVATLAEKTRQSVRAVQYQLRKMEEMGWLQLVGAGHGGYSKSRQYRINREWIAGGELMPPEKGANSAPLSEAPAEPKRVQNAAEKGATIAPAKEPQEPSVILSPQPPSRGADHSPPKPAEPFTLVGAAPSGPAASAKDRKPYPSPVELQTWLDDCKAAGVSSIPPDDPVFAYCGTVGIPRDVLALHWQEFVRRRRSARKRQKSWEQTFRNSVESNWFGLWVLTADGRCELSTKGRQAKAFHDAQVREAA